jgi:hypothetical protein
MHFNVIVQRSLIIGVGDGFFAGGAFAVGERIGWYNGTYMYRDLRKGDDSLVRLYGPRVLYFSVARFRRYELKVAAKIDDRHVFVVPLRTALQPSMTHVPVMETKLGTNEWLMWRLGGHLK